METPQSASDSEESMSSSLGEDTAQLDISQPLMFGYLSDVFRSVVPREQTGLGFDGWPTLLERADSGFEMNKALQAVASILEYLERNSPVSLVAATKILADGSRLELFRLPFGDNNVLGFYLNLLAKYADEHDWTSDALRLVGNTCADLDINRERALAKLDLPALLRRLTQEDKADVALGVLCNLCLDYEPAQVALRANHLFPSIIQLLERRSYKLDFLPQVSLLLDIAIGNFDPETFPDTQAITVIYRTITIPEVDIETQYSLANVIITLSTHEQIQKNLIADDKLLIFLDLFVFSYTQDAASSAHYSRSTSQKLHRRARDPENEAQLTALRSELSARLWDISALIEFSVKYLPSSEFVQSLISWLSTDESQMQLCACSILRNVASSDRNAIDMVMTHKIHHLLIPLLDDISDLRVLEELLRLMKNLAVPAANKIGLEAFESVTMIWSRFESPTLHYAAASLVRQLLKGCFGNVLRFVGPTSAQNDSYVLRFSQLYNNTNDLTIKTEIARAIVEMWRTANSGDSEKIPSQVLTMEKAMYKVTLSPDTIVKPVVAMLVKSENASLVTEGWFGLALMAGSEQLRETIYNALCEDTTKAVFQKTVSGQDVQSKDQDNARILADRLLKGTADDPSRLEVLRPLVASGHVHSELEPN